MIESTWTPLQDVRAEFTPEEFDRWSTLTETPLGPLRHLKPVVQMSETPPFWASPAVPLGYHRPAWPSREHTERDSAAANPRPLWLEGETNAKAQTWQSRS
jgi:hypothetical protein